MLARRPLQALPFEVPCNDSKMTPKTSKDQKGVSRTPSDSGKPRMILSNKNMIGTSIVEKPRHAKREGLVKSSSKNATGKPKSTKVRQNVVPANQLPFTIFEDKISERTTSAKQLPAEDAENVRPLADISKPREKKPKFFVEISDSKKEEKTNSVEEQIQWMTSKTGGEAESYWKEVAEERRLALIETLKESEQLHAIVKALKEDYAALEKVASQSEYWEKFVCDMVESEGVSVLHRSVQTDLEASDFEEFQE